MLITLKNIQEEIGRKLLNTLRISPSPISKMKWKNTIPKIQYQKKGIIFKFTNVYSKYPYPVAIVCNHSQ